MITVEEKAIEELIAHGMYQDQAISVMETVKASKENEAMLERWNDDVEGYPPPTLCSSLVIGEAGRARVY